MISYWRSHAKPIIAEVIKNNPGKSNAELKKLISKKYPFGERAYHPYKIWLDEVKRQLGEKPKLNSRDKTPDDPNQMSF